MATDLYYIGLLYVKPIPLDLGLLNARLKGKTTEGKLIINGFEISRNGQFKVHARDEKAACRKLYRLMKQIQSILEIRVAGIATYNSDGNLQAFFPQISDAMDFLGEVALETLIKLGLSENSAKSQAAVIANEVLCGMIRKGKAVYDNASMLGLRQFNENSGIIIVNENLRNSIIDAYADLIREKKIKANDESTHIRRLVKSIGQKKDDLFYGLAAALIMEAAVRLIVYLTTSPHSERGTCKIPNSLAENLKRETISASELGSEMKIGEPQALMLLNALEALGIVCIVEESSRTFKKTGKTSIPNVIGA
jgi:hypothetical protein